MIISTAEGKAFDKVQHSLMVKTPQQTRNTEELFQLDKSN